MVFKKDFIENIEQQDKFIWNMHHGILPEERGLFHPFWRMLEGKKDYGATLHEVSASIDKGNIINRVRVKLNENISMLENYINVAMSAGEMLIEILNKKLKNIQITTINHKEYSSKYYSLPKKEDILTAAHKGIHLHGKPEAMINMYKKLYPMDEALEDKVRDAIKHHELGRFFKKNVANQA